MLQLLDFIYNDFDNMNGYFHDIVGAIHSSGKEHHKRLYDIWMGFPTFHVFDEIRELLIKIIEENSVEVTVNE